MSTSEPKRTIRPLIAMKLIYPILMIGAFLTAVASESTWKPTSFINDVYYLGMVRGDANRVQKIITEVSRNKGRLGRLCVLANGMSFDVFVNGLTTWPKGAGFAKGDSVHAEFAENDRILKMVSGDRLWLFYRENGFGSDDQARILALFGANAPNQTR